MSTDLEMPGGKMAAEALAAGGRAMLEDAAAEEEQLELVDPLTAEEIFDAREALGGGAGVVSVMREARKRRVGRPKGAPNRRTDDFKRYIGQFGPPSAITLKRLASMQPEELVARSHMLDPEKRRMTYQDAVSIIIRCSEALLPYEESKQPVAIDATIRGVHIHEEFGRIPDYLGGAIVEGEILGVIAPRDDEGAA